MEIAIIIVLILLIVGGWLISTRRRLIVLEENAGNAMSQIGIQLASQYEMLMALMDLASGYSVGEALILKDNMETGHREITAGSAPEMVHAQKMLIGTVVGRVEKIAGDFPQLQADKKYQKYMDAVSSYGTMVQTSSLIYNDSAARLNRMVRMFPTSMAAGILGFRQREYVEIKGMN